MKSIKEQISPQNKPTDCGDTDCGDLRCISCFPTPEDDGKCPNCRSYYCDVCDNKLGNSGKK